MLRLSSDFPQILLKYCDSIGMYSVPQHGYCVVLISARHPGGYGVGRAPARMAGTIAGRSTRAQHLLHRTDFLPPGWRGPLAVRSTAAPGMDTPQHSIHGRETLY